MVLKDSDNSDDSDVDITHDNALRLERMREEIE